MAATPLRFYIGTYTQRGSEGIYRGELDPATGAVRITGSTADPHNPSFLAIHPNGRYLYACNEQAEGALAAYRLDPQSGALTLLGRRPSLGADPCYVSVAGGYALVANYSGGTIASLPIREDGSLGEAVSRVQHTGSGPTARQRGPHPHSIHPHPSGRWALVADLGLDRVFVYRLAQGKLVKGSEASLAPASGPRHLAFGSGGRFVYVVGELDSTVTAFGMNPESGALERLQTVSTLPRGYTATNYPADLHLHPNGRFLYASNREHDSLALFRVDPQTGTLTPAGHFPAGGKWPRSFAIDPAGRYLLAAHQKGDIITVFRINSETGDLTATGHAAAVPVPVCLKFLPVTG